MKEVVVSELLPHHPSQPAALPIVCERHLSLTQMGPGADVWPAWG